MSQQWVNCLQLLREGNYDKGWPKHEWIITGSKELGQFESTPTFGKPIWEGATEDITLLVNADFGMGDTMHFWRFIGEAESRVSKIILRCDECLHSLFDCDQVELVSKIDELPEFDKVIHMMALPHVLGSPSFVGHPYLFARGETPETVKSFGDLEFTKIGVCWSGNPFSPRNSKRAIPRELFDHLVIAEGLKLLNVVKHGIPPSDHYIDMRGFLEDWNATAHLLGTLDLMITVDTGMAHLAGATGTRTLLLLPFRPDWRWGSEGEKTVWYDSVHLIRQKEGEDWETFMLGVRDQLTELASSF